MVRTGILGTENAEGYHNWENWIHFSCGHTQWQLNKGDSIRDINGCKSDVVKAIKR